MEMMECCVPPGFRFHPTEEELVGYYLNRKVNSLKIDLDVITDVDLYRIEPWDIQVLTTAERCKLGYEEQNEWYFFSHKDRKYPTGSRTNRATAAGFWKATGRDKAVVSKEKIIGMRKTLVFYRGRAPNGKKTHWIMHEYRLQSSEHAPPQEEGWVVCRAFKKPIPNNKPAGYEGWNNSHCSYYVRDNNNNNNTSYMPPTTTLDASNNTPINHHQSSVINTTFNHQIGPNFPQFPFTPPPPPQHLNHGGGGYDQINQQLVELPQLDSPIVSTKDGGGRLDNAAAATASEDHEDVVDKNSYGGGDCSWKNLDYKMVAPPPQGMMNDHPVLPSYSFANMPLLIRDDDRNQFSHLLECFPDL